MSNDTYKGYKIRLYPTRQQEELMWKHINACRFVWNYMIEQENKSPKYLNNYDMSKILPKLKEENMWLKEVSATSLVTTCNDLHKSFTFYFNKTNGRPTFKSKKKSPLKYPIRNGHNRFYFDGNLVQIEKIGKIRFKNNNKVNDKLNKIKKVNPRISYVNNKWLLLFGVECENQVFEKSDKSMGIDLGIKELAVVSYGDKKLVFHNINKSKRMENLEDKLIHIKRVISRKYRVNGNYEKTNNIIKYEKLQKEIYYKLANIRQNYIHQTTHKLISLKPNKIVMENLNVAGMVKNKHLSKSIKEQKFTEFIRQMKYKCEWSGIEFIQADRFYPSSKLCSCCGNKKDNLKLSDRTYKCSNCGLIIDRDYNAAINLMNYVV